MTDILVKPIITEKMTLLGEKLNRYGFVVNKRANKIQIKEAIEKLFDVKILNVRTMNRGGKNRKYRNKIYKTSSWKKAVVTLKEGDRIDLGY